MPDRGKILADLSVDVVNTVWDQLAPIFGSVLVPVDEFRDALNQAAADVMELLDPAESFDVDVEYPGDRPSVTLAGLGDAYAKAIDNIVFTAEHPHIEP